MWKLAAGLAHRPPAQALQLSERRAERSGAKVVGAPAIAERTDTGVLIIFAKGPYFEFVGWHQAPKECCFIDELLIVERRRP